MSQAIFGFGRWLYVELTGTAAIVFGATFGVAIGTVAILYWQSCLHGKKHKRRKIKEPKKYHRIIVINNRSKIDCHKKIKKPQRLKMLE